MTAIQPICTSYHDFARQSFDRGKESGGKIGEKDAVEFGMCHVCVQCFFFIPLDDSKDLSIN